MRLLIYILLFLNISVLISEPLIEDAQKLVSKTLYKKHMQVLGNDIFEGRAPGTTGGNLAGKYIADKLDNYQLKPKGDNSTFYQYIQMHGSFPLDNSMLTIYTDSIEYDLELGKDYLLYKTGEQTFNPIPLELVFVGYGIIAPEYDYNDYQTVDIEGKIAVFLSGEPSSDDSAYFNGTNNTIHSIPETKQRLALAQGAAGSILIPDIKDFAGDVWNRYINSFGFEDLTLAYSPSGNLSILMNPVISELLFSDSEYSLEQVIEMERNHTLKSFPLNTKLSFIGSFKERDFLSPNIVSVIEGSDPILKDSYIIVSAHYDHLGIGPKVENDSIYNGVIDNASGVSANLEIARCLVQANINTKRSIIFLFTTGEEKGLLGAEYYIENPIVPLYKTAVCINNDGIAFIDEFKSIIAVGSELSSILKNVKKAADEENVFITSIPPEFIQYESFYLSDQYAFAKAGIPAILISDGPDYKTVKNGLDKLKHYSSKIYHTPFDDLEQEINYDASIQHIKLLIRLIIDIANSEEEIVWKPGTPYSNARLRSKAEKK